MYELIKKSHNLFIPLVAMCIYNSYACTLSNYAIEFLCQYRMILYTQFFFYTKQWRSLVVSWLPGTPPPAHKRGRSINDPRVMVLLATRAMKHLSLFPYQSSVEKRARSNESVYASSPPPTVTGASQPQHKLFVDGTRLHNNYMRKQLYGQRFE